MPRERSRQEVLEDLVQRYAQELSTAWATGMTHHRLRALRASLDSARAELRELLRDERFSEGSGVDETPVERRSSDD